MHEYISNKSHRKTVIAIIAIISLLLNSLLAPAVDFLINKLSQNLHPYLYPFIILLGVGFSLIFGILFFLFDRLIWKIIPGIKMKNLNGVYQCVGVSSYEQKQWSGDLLIKQTWSKILIKLSTESSESISFMANISVEDDGEVILNYCYNNCPNCSNEDLKKHEGTADIRFTGKSIKGKYYNYPNDRPRHGELTLIKGRKTNEF